MNYEAIAKNTSISTLFTSKKIDILPPLMKRYEVTQMIKLICFLHYLHTASGHPTLPGAVLQHLPVVHLHHHHVSPVISTSELS